MFFDNGTNFVRTARIEWKLQKDPKENNKVISNLENEQIDKHFIPQAEPHFGGIWEDGVKSVKYHL